MARLTAEQVADGLFHAAGIAIAAGKNNVATGMLSAMEMIRENLIESPDERRKRFERWFAVQNPLNSLARDGAGYLYPAANEAWQVWNAALDFGGGGGE